MEREVAKITGTQLGWEDHGILTATLCLTYGGGSGQWTPGYCLDEPTEQRTRVGTAYGLEFIARLMKACGVRQWEDLKGRTIYALKEDRMGVVEGIENLPTEPGCRFMFRELAAEMDRG